MDKLKSCPFCDGNAALDRGVQHTGVICLDCGVRTEWYILRVEAVDAWNRRSNNANIK